MSQNQVFYTCGFRPSTDSTIRKTLPFAYMSGVRLGGDTFDDQKVLEFFRSLDKFTGTVVEHTSWSELAVLKLEISDQVITILSGLDIYSKAERDGFVYKYSPMLHDGSKQKELHITFGKNRHDLFEKFPPLE